MPVPCKNTLSARAYQESLVPGCPLVYNCGEQVFGFGQWHSDQIDSARILIVDDQEDILLAARLLLKRHFASVRTLRDPATCRSWCGATRSTSCSST